MTEYTIETVVTVAGTLKAYLYTEEDERVIPTFPSLFPREDFIERVDIIPGTVQPEEIDIEYTEDYSVYADGFWANVVKTESTAQLRVTLNEGALGELTLFWGKIISLGSVHEEFDLTVDSLSNAQRRGTIHCVSLLTALQDVEVEDCFTRFDITYNLGTDDYRYIKLWHLIANMVAVAFSQDFDEDNCVILADDFKYKEGSNYWVFSDLQFKIVYHPSVTQVGYRWQWPDKYGNAFDLLKEICRSFGFVPRYCYDDVNDKHQIQLLTRGRSFAANITIADDVPIQSNILFASDTAIKGVAIGDAVLNTGSWYISGMFSVDPLDENQSQDLDITFNRLFTWDSIAAQHYWFLYKLDGSNNPAEITGMQYYDYVAGAFSSDESGDNFIHSALTKYLWQRFSPTKKGFDRTYATLKANDGSTDSQKNLHVMRQMAISDRINPYNFYALEVSKNVFRNETHVVWNQV